MSGAAHPPDDREQRQFERLAFFSDAVFAIAITLLVLDLKAPSGPKFRLDLAELGPAILGFVISFSVIAIYWLTHHAIFGALVREDRRLRVANLFFLASIAFLPFPTSIIARYPATTGSVIFYALSVALVGFFEVILILAARRQGLMRHGETSETTRWLIARGLTPPTIFLISTVVALAAPGPAQLTWILIWPGLRLVDFLAKPKPGKDHAGVQFKKVKR
jgi:uncharacterized membrane protein